MTRYARTKVDKTSGRTPHSGSNWSDLKSGTPKSGTPKVSQDVPPQEVSEKKKKSKKVAKSSVEFAPEEDLQKNEDEPKKKKRKIKKSNETETQKNDVSEDLQEEFEDAPSFEKEFQTNVYIDKRKLYNQESSADLEKLLEEYKFKGVEEELLEIIRRRWKKRESRRVGRQEDKLSNKKCFQCRKSGHVISDCPQPKSQATGICFKCASTEHTVHQCKSRVKGYPYATCFVCKLEGHLSRDCPQNPNGAFPEGGGCNYCSAKDHLAFNCPTISKDYGNGNNVVARLGAGNKYASVDDEIFPPQNPQLNKKKGVKVVKF